MAVRTIYIKYELNPENGGINPDVSGLIPPFEVTNLVYLIVEEVSKTIEIVNSRMCLCSSLEFIISIVLLGFMGYTSAKEQKKPTRLLNKLL